MFLLGQAFGPKGVDPGHSQPINARLNTDLALDYGQLAGVHVDLRHCQHLCNRMLELRPQLKRMQKQSLPENQILQTVDEMRMTMITALVVYVRCFSGGKRLRLDHTQVWKEKDPARDAHHYFKNVRDKFVAHPVNDFEDVAVALTYVMEEDHPVIFAVSDAYGASVLPNEYLIRWLRRLSKQAQKYVENRLDQLRPQLIKAGKSLTVDELQALPKLLIKAGNFNEPGKAKD